MDNDNSIHTNNVNYDDIYCGAYNIATSVHNNECTTYQTACDSGFLIL